MTMVKAPNAVAFLLDEISRNDLIPEQIIVEFTEREVISRMDDFTDAVRKLKGAGINLAIDHFGAGFAGLSLLAQYQPDRIKIDHELIRNIHRGRTAPVDCTGDYQMLYFSGDCGLSRRR